jgi:hypothetical protein
MTQRSNVLRVNTVEEQARYRNAVAEIVQRILAENSRPGDAYTLACIAESIDVSLGTISNAANKRADLSPTYLQRLGQRYGPHVLDPWHKLYGARGVPLEVDTTRDVLPFISRFQLKLAEVRDPAGPGGAREIHTEKAGYLPELRAMIREAQMLACQIEAELAA